MMFVTLQPELALEWVETGIDIERKIVFGAAAGYDLGRLQRELLIKLGGRDEALEIAWAEHCRVGPRTRRTYIDVPTLTGRNSGTPDRGRLLSATLGLGSGFGARRWPCIAMFREHLAFCRLQSAERRFSALSVDGSPEPGNFLCVAVPELATAPAIARPLIPHLLGRDIAKQCHDHRDVFRARRLGVELEHALDVMSPLPARRDFAGQVEMGLP